jgi:tRNA(fMet)-specific endonuclease VapC
MEPIEAPKRKRSLKQVQAFTSKFLSLPFDDRAAEVYGEIRAHLAGLGTPIGPNDLLIAAIALANSLTLVTHNTAEFSPCQGWYWKTGSRLEQRVV